MKDSRDYKIALHDKDRKRHQKGLKNTWEKNGSRTLRLWVEECHKEPGYYGFWSFDTAALAKILGLDDSALKNNNHYPYDLAHYKME